MGGVVCVSAAPMSPWTCRILRTLGVGQEKMVDKSELVQDTLDKAGIRYNPTRNGWQPIQCPNEAGHANGDRNPSCRLNLQLGLVKCHGCDLVGDAYNIVMKIEGIDFVTAKGRIGGVVEAVESDWII